jgi:putative tryptophan/tyrosine transport system substrate-binding protein
VRRRTFFALLGPTCLWPRWGSAQENGRTYHLAFVAQPPQSAPQWKEVLGELSRLGFVDGQNLSVDPRGFGLALDRIEQTISEVIAASPDAIYCGGDVALRAVARTTQTIPVVALLDDYLATGLVKSLSHPGGNLTGMSLYSTELERKRIDLLLDLLPDVRKIALVGDRRVAASNSIEASGDMIRARKVDVAFYWVNHEHEIVPTLKSAKAEGAEALSILSSPLLHSIHARIISILAGERIPAIFQWPEYVAEGALIAYGARLTSVFRKIGGQIGRVLLGKKPGDIPIELPTRFELAINLQTARTLGIAVPPLVMARADKVVE